MEIRIAHRFPCSPQEYWDATHAPGVEDEMRREADVDHEVLERADRGATILERARISPRKELPAVAQKALGVARFSYVQEVELDNTQLTTRWKVLPDVMRDKVRCEGTSRVVATPDGCERIIEGEIKVGVPFIGGTIEKHIVEMIGKSYDRAADVVRRHLPGRPA